MLRCYLRFLGLAPALVPVLAALEARNVDLHRQVRRALESAALNMGEASGNEGGTRRQRFLSSLGSLREAVVGLEVAAAFGHVVVPAELMRELSGIIGTLVVLVRGRR